MARMKVWDAGSSSWVYLAQPAQTLVVSTFMRTVLDDTDATTARTTLGVPTAVGGVEWTNVIKASDESVTSNTTIQADDELFFTAANNAIYEIELFLIYVSPAGGGTPDIKYGFGEDATGTRGLMAVLAYFSTADAAAGTPSAPIATNQTTIFGAGSAAGNRVTALRGWHIGAGGTWQVLWAQNTSNANALTVKAGSVLRYRRII